MNRPPEDFVAISHEDLCAFVSEAAQTVGLPEDKSELLAACLTANDLRGVFSHGTQQIATYARLMRDGILNKSPNVRVDRETPVSVRINGDGGLGYFPAYEGTQRVIEKAKSSGIAVMSSFNHGHFGAAGIYSRLTARAEDAMLCIAGAGLQRQSQDGPTYIVENLVGLSVLFFPLTIVDASLKRQQECQPSIG